MAYYTESHIRMGQFNDCPVDRMFMRGALYSQRKVSLKRNLWSGMCLVDMELEQRDLGGFRHLMSHLFIKVLLPTVHTALSVQDTASWQASFTSL